MSRFRLLPLPLLPLAAFCLLPAGCGIQEPVRRYEVAKRVDVQQASATEANDRMLVAYAVSGGTAWFFKLQGPKDKVAAHADSFLKLLQSVHFGAEGPAWTPPKGWKQLPGNALRYATLLTEGDEPLEVSVIGLPYSGEDEFEYALVNLNRWRRQMQLPPIGPFELDDQIKHIELDGKPGVLASLVGTLSEGPPMAGGMPPGAVGPSPPPASRGEGVTFDVPEGWEREKINDPVSRVALKVVDGQRRVDITISAAGGSLLANLNRWRKQVGVPDMSQAELDAALAKAAGPPVSGPAESADVPQFSLAKIDVAGTEADYVAVFGPESASPRKAILGVIAPARGTTWFIKLTGDPELAQREQPRFESFVKSLQFE